MTLQMIATLLQNPATRSRMMLMGQLENELHTLGVKLGEHYRDGLVSEGDVRLGIRAEIHSLTETYKLTLFERDHLFKAAHNVSGVSQL